MTQGDGPQDGPPPSAPDPGEEPESRRGRRRRGGRAYRGMEGPLRGLVLYGSLVAAAFVIGVLLFNIVIMPAFVRHHDEIRVPDLTGKDLTAAEAALTGAGLTLGDTRRRPDQRPPGTVVAQHPQPGLSVKTGRAVAVVVSQGLEGSPVPDLSGQSMRNARLALESAQLTIGQVLTVPSAAGAAEDVIATEPPAGSTTPPGTAVNVLVSGGGGGTFYLMPDFRGLEASTVERRLREAGFTTEVENQGGLSLRGRPRVVDQHPEPGARVIPGGLITLVAG